MIARRFSRRVRNWGNVLRLSSLAPTGLFGTPIVRPADMQRMADVGEIGCPRSTALCDSQEAVPAQGLQHSGNEALAQASQLRGGDPVILQVLDNLSNDICVVGDAIEAVRLLHPELEFRKAATAATQSLGGYLDVLNTNTSFHTALQRLLDSSKFADLDDEAQRAAYNFMRDFEQSGAGSSDAAQKAQFRALNERAQQLSMTFETFASASASQSYSVPLDQSRTNIVARTKTHLGWNSASAAVDSTLAELLQTRLQLGRHAKCPSFAHKVMQANMAHSPSVVADFLSALSAELRAQRTEDIQEIRDVLGDKDNALLLNSGESFIRHGVAERLLAATQAARGHSPAGNEMRPYLSLTNCLSGLRLVCREVFDVALKEVHPRPGEVHHPSVRKIEVHDTSGQLGTVFLDLLARPSKASSGAAHYTVQTGCQSPGAPSRQLPVVILDCSISPKSPFLSLDETITLFHEFGHALHSMFGQTRFQTVAGTRCALDFVELPSTLMEEYLRDYAVVSQFARHETTGEPLPAEIFHGHQRVKKLCWATDQLQTVLLATLDQELHGPTPLRTSLRETSDRVRLAVEGFLDVGAAPLHHRFFHLATYPAGYYAYPWCKALAGLVWQRLFAKDCMSRAAGTRYRTELLAYGDGRDPWLSMQRTLGFKPAVSDLVTGFMAAHRQSDP